MRYLETINRFVCGVPALLFILGVGIYLSVRTRFAQIRFFPRSLRMFAKQITGNSNGSDETSSYQAFCTALAATVGTGNLAGVAGAITIGGPGAVFWMWICGILGMITKFGEATLAVYYRVRKSDGTYIGGPMYMIEKGLPEKYRLLAMLYCMMGVVAAFGVGNSTQINAVIGGINSAFNTYDISLPMTWKLVLGIFFAVTITLLMLGGMKRIGRATERMVPLASLFYIVLCIGALIICRHRVAETFSAIFRGAFLPKAVTGGVIGSMFISLRVGAARGVFTNEAGLGTASIAHAASNVKYPADQGLMGIMEVFIDTLVICTMTALVILSSGMEIPYGFDNGASVTAAAFVSVYGDWVSIPLAISLCLFAIASILGWGLYGGRCLQYLFGDGAWKPFVLVQAIVVVVGACLETGAVWLVAETVNALMAIPNLLTLVLLCPRLVILIKEFEKKCARCKQAGTRGNLRFRFPKEG